MPTIPMRWDLCPTTNHGHHLLNEVDRQYFFNLLLNEV